MSLTQRFPIGLASSASCDALEHEELPPSSSCLKAAWLAKPKIIPSLMLKSCCVTASNSLQCAILRRPFHPNLSWPEQRGRGPRSGRMRSL